MALSAPIPIIEGSQTEFSKVWIRGSTATSTLPNLRFYKADGRIVHPIAAALDITIVHTAADTLYNRIQAAITAADATKTAAWVAKWFGKHQIVGVTSDAITGDALLVNRAETTGITASNDEPTARAAADFFAQETYATGTRFRHGILPGDQSGLNGATVNVSGEVETSQAWKTGTPVVGTVTNAADYIQGDCAGMASVHAEATSITSTGPGVRFDCYVNGAWQTSQLAGYGAAGTLTTGVSTTFTAVTAKLWGRVLPGATAFRIVMISGATGPHTIKATPSAQPWNPSPGLSAGAPSVNIQTAASHDAAASSATCQVSAEARSTDGTAVGSGDASRLLATLLGKLVSMPYALPGQTWRTSAATGGITSATTTVAKAASGATGTRYYITSFQIENMSTTTSEVAIQSASTDLWRGEFDADGGCAGISVTLPVPIRCGDNEAINIVTTGAGKVFVNIQGYTAAAEGA